MTVIVPYDAGTIKPVLLQCSWSALIVNSRFFRTWRGACSSAGAAFVADPCMEKHFGAAMRIFGTIFDIGHAPGPILARRFSPGTTYVYLCVLCDGRSTAAGSTGM